MHRRKGKLRFRKQAGRKTGEPKPKTRAQQEKEGRTALRIFGFGEFFWNMTAPTKSGRMNNHFFIIGGKDNA